MSVRQPAVAGGFYAERPEMLHGEVQAYLDQAMARVEGKLCALIAPHAGYAYCGNVAGEAFAQLRRLDGKRRVLHLGPSHHALFRGLAASPDDAWQTPLGGVPIDYPAQLDESALVLFDSRPHAPEHSLEVQLPFLQCALPQFSYTPLLTGKIDAATAAAELLPLIDSATLIVASTDLSHFHPDRQARKLDGVSNDAIAALDTEGFARDGDACGKAAVLVLMHLALWLGWQPHLLAYRTSAEAFGDKSQVVGYSAFAFTAQ